MLKDTLTNYNKYSFMMFPNEQNGLNQDLAQEAQEKWNNHETIHLLLETDER